MYEIFLQLLHAYGITSADVCRATGIREQTISNWKRRRNYLSFDTAILIADYFGVSLDYLMRGKNLPPAAVPKSKEQQSVYSEFVKSRPDYKRLFDACMKVKKSDVDFVREVIERVSR